MLLPVVKRELAPRLLPPHIARAERSIGYMLRAHPTSFVFSRPQQIVRIVTNAEMAPTAKFPIYGIMVEALDSAGQTISRQRIFARSIQLFVHDARKRPVPRSFRLDNNGATLSAGDVALIDFGQPVSAVRIAAVLRENDVSGVIVRVQEHRPVSARQLAIGWDRASASDRAEMGTGNPLPPALISEPSRQRLLKSRWRPVGPAGVYGRDYAQVVLYERRGAVFPLPDNGS